MSKDDSTLYTGVSYKGSFDNIPVDRKELEAEKEQEEANFDLLPSAEYCIEVIDEEIESVKSIHTYIATLGSKPTKDEIEAEFRARALYFDLCERLKKHLIDRTDTAKEKRSE